jgi:hypothetical protein
MGFQRLSFGDFSLARQRKVTAPPGAHPGAVSRSEKKQHAANKQTKPSRSENKKP